MFPEGGKSSIVPEPPLGDLPSWDKLDLEKIRKEDEQVNIDKYFTKEQLDAMAPYEMYRYKNLTRNYNMMLRMGLPAIKPDFMLPSSKKIKYKPPVKDTSSGSDEEWTPDTERKKILQDSSSDGSDEEWTPHMNRKKKEKKMKQLYPGFTAPKKPKFTTQKNEKVQENSTPKKPIVEKCAKETTTKREYFLRERPLSNFMALESPDDDHFLYCEECNKEYDGDCPIHGPLDYIHDTQVTDMDNNSPNRAISTLPPGLVVRKSSIPSAGLGVWSEVEFPARVKFGPYGGEIVSQQQDAHESGYAWQIYKDGKPGHFVDAKDPVKSNWMRYVNCAAMETEQNLVAYQYEGEIYYRSYKPITAHTELLVWYGAEYARELGMVRDKNLLIRPKYVNNEEVYPCVFCKMTCGSKFSTVTKYIKHLLLKHSCDSLTKDDILTFRSWLNKNGVDISYRGKRCTYQGSIKTDAQKENQENHSFSNGNNGHHHTIQSGNVGNMKWSNSEGMGEGDDMIKNYKCDVCNLYLSESTDLQKHQRIHTGDRPYRCDVCGKTFTQAGPLQGHQRIHKGDRPYRCDVCGKTFTQAGPLQGHQRIHTGDRPYRCDVCGKTFTKSSELQVHQRIHTGDRPYKCDVCGKTFTEAGSLQGHQRIHTGDRPYKCDVCGKTFTQAGSLQKHQRLHTGDRPYRCDVCGRTFTQAGHLQRHLRIHTGDRPYRCDVCGKTFTDSCNLQTHQRIHTGDRPYRCDVCGKTFTEAGSLQKHQRLHTGDRPYRCDVCGKTFTQGGDLQRHKRIHTGDRPYRCDVCGKTFTDSCNLQKHQRLHTGDRPYRCDVCGKTFTQSCNLQTHQRIHTGDRPYRCDVCGKTFTEAGHLQTHQRLHTGVKPYKCDVCGKTFTVSGNLQTHQRLHTGVKPYKCDVCHVSYTNLSSLRHHNKKQHFGSS